MYSEDRHFYTIVDKLIPREDEQGDQEYEYFKEELLNILIKEEKEIARYAEVLERKEVDAPDLARARQRAHNVVLILIKDYITKIL